jgi:hypothetical protein
MRLQSRIERLESEAEQRSRFVARSADFPFDEWRRFHLASIGTGPISSMRRCQIDQVGLIYSGSGRGLQSKRQRRSFDGMSDPYDGPSTPYRWVFEERPARTAYRRAHGPSDPQPNTLFFPKPKL